MAGGGTLAKQGLPDAGNALSGVWKIQDADGIGAVVIHKALLPIRPIHHRGHVLAGFDTATMQFTVRQVLKALGIGQTGAV